MAWRGPESWTNVTSVNDELTNDLKYFEEKWRRKHVEPYVSINDEWRSPDEFREREIERLRNALQQSQRAIERDVAERVKQQLATSKATYYILDKDGKTPIVEKDAGRWALWMAHCPSRVLQQDVLADSYLSTVFIGVQRGNDAYLWESFVGDTPLDLRGMTRYYKTYDEAKAGHKALLAMLGAFGRAITIREDEK